MKNKRGLPFILGGLLLIAAALSLSIYNIWDDNRATAAVDEAIEELDVLIPKPEDVELPYGMIPDHILNPKMEMPTVTVKDYDYVGYLEIPDLDLSLPVMSEWSYPLLKISPCRYAGTVYQGNMVIAAHNYQRHFGQLKELSIGAEIRFIDVDGNRFVYSVGEMEQLNPTQVKDMTESDWDLTLFTCTISGQARFTVRCERVDETISESYRP